MSSIKSNPANENSSKADVYIVGAGAIAAHHARSIPSETARLAGVVEIDQQRRERFLESFPGIEGYASITDFVSEQRTRHSLVIVATPPPFHFDLCRDLLSGQYHVLCEKPLTTTAHEARVLSTMAREVVESIVRHFPTLRILTTNPDPLPDGRAKTDSMLQAEIEDLSICGSIAAEHGLSLSLHFHTPELQNESRELRAIMDAVDPELLKLTFDVNWCLRGGESISDMLDRCQQRVNVTHLRSSRDGVWEEVLSDGDEAISSVLERLWADPIERVHVIELADEPQMTITQKLVERLQSSRERLDRWREHYEARVPTNSP